MLLGYSHFVYMEVIDNVNKTLKDDMLVTLRSGSKVAIAVGTEVKEIFVIEVSLKNRDYDPKNIVLLAKSIPQRVIYLLRFEDEAMLSVYHSKLFTAPWLPIDSATVALSGLNLNAVWESVVSSIGQFSVEQENSLTEQIKVDEERDKLLRQIAVLERQMNATKQPRRKRELFIELQKFKEV